jgi:uncharacterized protein YndB with AHSA1/START domain
MATTIIALDQDAVISEIHIAAPPERVFAALTDPKQVMSWWASDKCHIDNYSIGHNAGGRYIHDTKRVNGNDVVKLHCEGEVLEYDPPHRLAYTWIADWHDNKSLRTVVRWELTPCSGGTQVKVSHSGLTREPAAREEYGNGWPNVVQKLKNFVEQPN